MKCFVFLVKLLFFSLSTHLHVFFCEGANYSKGPAA
jgi:hypothetical protein